MLLGWFSARQATRLGAALADQYPLPPREVAVRARQLSAHERAVREHLQRAARETRTLQLNFYKRARFANSFKWRLLARGVDPSAADDATQALVLSLFFHRRETESTHEPGPVATSAPGAGNARTLQAQGDEAFARGEYDEAATHYQALLSLKPGRLEVLNQLAGTFCKLGRLGEAEKHYRRAIGREPSHPDAHGSLGAIHLARGCLIDAETSLRRALKLQPGNLDHRSNLGVALAGTGRLDNAIAQLERVLKVDPRHANALYAMGLVARAQGRFEEAAAFFRRAVDSDPSTVRAWAELAGIRKMSAADGEWLLKAQEMLAAPLAPFEEARLRFAIGKYHDDLEQFEEAFASYERGNTLLKTVTAPYEREVRTRLVDDLIRVYTSETMAGIAAAGSGSTRPVFVVGMMRSGTSLIEQIIASHPEAAGAGELDFWSAALRGHESEVRRDLLDAQTRAKLAAEYLRALQSCSAQALRVVDKAPVNCDYLGIILSVFPNARIIYVRRDPIDTCLSCYFQLFSTALNFARDLSDLAHYYREHQRLMAHWRAVCPSESLLEVPYEELVADQEQWTRRIVNFLDLPWHPQCLEFHRTDRTILTSSYWQVRQRIYNNSVRRARHYRKFIGPLLDLKP
ncbi:MAG TPA: sulfotransferase [Steroidobacteraceae bacterium]|jgi:tetratricopeptide (TPR) repeat protein